MTATTRIVRRIEDLAAVRTDWESLLARSAASAPTLSPAWLLAWWRAFGSVGARTLSAVLVEDGARLIGLAPLLTRRTKDRLGVPIVRVELLASGEDEADETCSDYIGVLAERGAELAVAEALGSLLAGPSFGAWSEIALSDMNGDTTLPLLLAEALRARGCVARVEVTGACHYARLPPTWDEYLAALPASSRSLVRRSLRDVEAWAEGPLEVEHARTKEDLARGMEILAALHAERWRAEEREGVFASPRFRAFHADVAEELLGAGALDLIVLHARGEPLAAAYNLRWGRRVLFYQSGRSMRAPRRIRPGIVLHAHAIRAAIESGCTEYDFLAGTSRYKTELADGARPVVLLHATRPSLAGAARRATALALDELRGQLRARKTARSLTPIEADTRAPASRARS